MEISVAWLMSILKKQLTVPIILVLGVLLNNAKITHHWPLLKCSKTIKIYCLPYYIAIK